MSDTRCHILRLPLELRLQIAIYAVGTGPRPEDAAHCQSLAGYLWRYEKEQHTALLHVAGFDELQTAYPHAFLADCPALFVIDDADNCGSLDFDIEYYFQP